MKVFNFEIDSVPQIKTDAVCIGKFDGIHKGHEALLNVARSISDDVGILTFTPPPFVYFQKNAKVLFLQEEKTKLMQTLGVKTLYNLTFNSTLAMLEGEEFCQKISPLAGMFIIGEDFCFGKDRKRNATQMQIFGKKYGFDVKILPTVKNVDFPDNGDVKISSGILKRFVLQGNFPAFNKIALSMFFVDGVVLHGKKVAGSTLGFATANMVFADGKTTPPFGVYTTLTEVDGIIYESISNFGIKPTFEGQSAILETHIFNFRQEIYGKNITVYFVEHIREEKKFSDINQLKFQISQDIDTCKKIHQGYESYQK